MNRWIAWRSVLGPVSLCLAIAGCGGSDIPDPDADTNAAAEPTASGPTGPAAPAAAPAPAPAVAAAPGAGPAEAPAAAPTEAPAPAPEPAVAATAPAAAAPAEMPPAATPAATADTATAAAPGAATAPAEGEAAAATADPNRAKNSAATAELLALGNKPLPAEEPAPAATPGAAAPGAMANNMMPGPIPGPGAPAAAPGAITPIIPAEAPGAPGAAGPGAEIPGYPGATDGANPGGTDEPADFRTPASAVEAFLKALKAKNPERLAEATARRAPTEAAGPKNQKLFASILEQSLTEDDLNDLANKLDEFQVVGFNTPKSSGRFTLILSKSGKNGESYRRTITARHEKEGWKVLDISGVGTVEKPIMGARRRR